MASLDRIKLIVKNHGVARGFAAAVLRIANRVVFVNVLKGLVVHAVSPELMECDAKYRTQFIPEATLRALSTNPVYELGAEFLSSALATGHECYGVLAGDRLVAYGWYSNTPTETDAPGLTLHFNPRYVYMYKGFTLPDHRGHRLHALAMTRALEAYLARGYEGLVSYVEWANFDSLKSCYRMGCEDFGNLYMLRIFGRYWLRADAGCKRYGFKLVATPRRDWPD